MIDPPENDPHKRPEATPEGPPAPSRKDEEENRSVETIGADPDVAGKDDVAPPAGPPPAAVAPAAHEPVKHEPVSEPPAAASRHEPPVPPPVDAGPGAPQPTTTSGPVAAGAPEVEATSPSPPVTAPAPPPQPAPPPAGPAATGTDMVHSDKPSGAKAGEAVSAALTNLTLPNLLTSIRCVLVLVVLVLLLWPWGPQLTAALIVFGLASFTDWLDGRLARSLNLITPLGRMLDSIADKLLIGVTLIAMCAIGVIDGLNVFAAALILAREIAISGLREHLGPKGVVVPASDLGKWKTTFQMVALAALMAAPLAPFPTVARVAALLILWAAMAMTLVSGFQYAWGSRKEWSEP